MTFLSLTAQEVQDELEDDQRIHGDFAGMYLDELVEAIDRPEDEVEAALRELKAKRIIVGVKGVLLLTHPE